MSNSVLKWGLMASILVNAFLLGVGTHFLDHPHGPPPPPDPDQMIEQMTETLSVSDAAIMRNAFNKERATLQQDKGPHEMHQKIRAALLAEPFDPQRLQQVFDEEERGHTANGAAIGRMIVTAASEMSPEGRHRLAEFRPGPK